MKTLVMAAAGMALLVGGLAGCGGNDAAGSSSVAKSTPSPPDLYEACAAVTGDEPTSTSPSASEMAKSAKGIKAVADKYRKGTIENDAFSRLAAAYKSGSGVTSALTTVSGICEDAGGTTATPTTAPPDPLAGKFPRGFPKKVPLSQVPSPISSAFEGRRFVVQVARGVYADLPPGATVRDAALGDVFNGYCASVDAYSRRFRGGEQFGGECW